MKFELISAPAPVSDATHHAPAAQLNQTVVDDATRMLRNSLAASRGEMNLDPGNTPEKILLKAAAGAGKSFALRSMVRETLDASPAEDVVGVTAFTNKQIRSLTRALTHELDRDQVCWLMSRARLDGLQETNDPLLEEITVVSRAADVPPSTRVVLGTSHRLGARGERYRLGDAFSPDGTSAPFRVLFVDEAWQLPHHLFTPVEGLASTIVGVGDVGQLPPLEIGENPWRGDTKYNPLRAWPHAFEGEPLTWSAELPTVWRPHGNQLGLWRAFYPNWEPPLSSVAAPKDRHITADGLTGALADLFEPLAAGHPVALEVAGLPEADAPDVDLPLTEFIGHLVGNLLAASITLVDTKRDPNTPGDPTGAQTVQSPHDDGDPLVALLATRNQAVDDAQDLAQYLTEEFELPEGQVQASTVDSWQGQTNGITVATHPLSGADALDDFNSAFGRLAVACTRATHGLLLVSRPGLDDLLNSAAARAGTPFGEPGRRQLPRQTHQRILDSFVKARITVDSPDMEG